MTENPAIKALTLALRDNAADLTTQDKTVREAEATLDAAQNQMTALRTQREGLQAALSILRSPVAPID
jgi:septal ring factor EnvC (AmiA/AmiB activator)